MSCNNSCCNCNKLLKSTSLVVSSTALTINVNIPSEIENNTNYCLVICQSIPATALTLPVSVQWSNGTIIPVLSKNGNKLRADMITSRMKYKITFGTDPIHYIMDNLLPCSSFKYTITSAEITDCKTLKGTVIKSPTTPSEPKKE